MSNKTGSRMAGPGVIVNRHAKDSKLEIAIDPSPDGFLSTARQENGRIKLMIVPGNGSIDPIEVMVSPKIWVFKFERAQIPAERLADLEHLITEEQDVHCVLEYTPSQEDLPFEPDKPAAERTYDIDADGFVKNPIEIQVIVPDFLKAECKLLFACVAGYWFYGFKIGGCIERERRVNTLRADGVADPRGCLLLLADSISESLHKDKSRLAEFIRYKIATAIRAIEDSNADLAEAMAEPVHLPADFAEEKKEGSTTEGTEDTEKESDVNASTLQRSNASTPQEDSHAEAQGRGEEPIQEPEVKTLKAKGIQKAAVTVRLQRRGDDWRYGFEWQLGNFADGQRLEACGWYACKELALRDLHKDLSIMLAEIEITGSADHRRSIETRRKMLVEQATEWLEEMIDAAESETGHKSRGTSDDNGTEAEPVEFEEDQPRD